MCIGQPCKEGWFCDYVFSLHFFTGRPLAIPIQLVNNAWRLAQKSGYPKQADFIWNLLHFNRPNPGLTKSCSSDMVPLPCFDFMEWKPKLLAYGKNPQPKTSVIAKDPLVAFLPSICQLPHCEDRSVLNHRY
jgi:hypothetical protein